MTSLLVEVEEYSAANINHQENNCSIDTEKFTSVSMCMNDSNLDVEGHEDDSSVANKSSCFANTIHD